MIYTETVYIKKTEFERINRLLAIESLEEMTDSELLKAGANTDYHEGIFGVVFEDGCSLTWDLCSGQTNYWDDVIFRGDDGDLLVECAFELNDIELKINNNTYIVKLELT